MSIALLDVNFLVSLAWPNHLCHNAATAWFLAHQEEGFATCPITEAGFVRISLNPKVVGEAKSTPTVLSVLARFKELPGHVFWPADLDLESALIPLPLLAGHRQVTDFYLLSLATAKGGSLATFDRGIKAAMPEELARRVLVIEVQT